MKKRRHHYVWRHFLEAWAAADGTVACYQAGRTFSARPANVAVQKDFYRLRELSEADVEFLERLIGGLADDTLRRANAHWLRIFRAAFALRRDLKANDMLDAEANRRIEVVIQNAEEDLHSGIEGDAIEPSERFVLGRSISCGLRRIVPVSCTSLQCSFSGRAGDTTWSSG